MSSCTFQMSLWQAHVLLLRKLQQPYVQEFLLTTPYQITTLSLYTTLQWSIPLLLKSSESPSLNPAFLVTSGGLYREPIHFLFSLSAGKAAQHNLVSSFHQKFEPRIHIALIPISGVVKDDAKVTTAQAVAEEFWGLYVQKKGAGGKLQVEMEDPEYYDNIEGLRKMVEGES